MIRAVLFDLDDTLIDRTSAFARLSRYWFNSLPARGRPASEEDFVASMMTWDKDGYAPRPEVYRRMLESWPGCFSDLGTALAVHNATLPTMVSLHPSTATMLEQLRARGTPVGVVTNGPTDLQWEKLRAASVERLVDSIVVSAEFGVNKPDPAIFRHALGLIGAGAAETLFVGDNPVNDIGGAAGVGMVTAWMRLGRTWDVDAFRPDHVLENVWEARGLVDF